MRKLNILILWVSLSGDESIAVYQDAVQKGKWTRLLEKIHRQSPWIFFFFFFLRFLPKWTPEKNMSPGWAALGPFLRVLATVPWALRAWLVRWHGRRGTCGRTLKGRHLLGTVEIVSFKCSHHRMLYSLPYAGQWVSPFEKWEQRKGNHGDMKVDGQNV